MTLLLQRIGSAAMIAGIAAASAPVWAMDKAHGPIGTPYSWFSPDDYPAEALRRGEQGRVVAQIWIDETGRLVSCKVIGSSGSAALDQATCAIALKDRRYQPATDRNGRPIASQTPISIRWALPKGMEFGTPVDVSVQPPPVRTLDMTVTVAGDGTLEGCHADVTGRRPGETDDPCERMKVGSKVSAGFVRNGVPVGGRIVTHYSEQVLIDP